LESGANTTAAGAGPPPITSFVTFPILIRRRMVEHRACWSSIQKNRRNGRLRTDRRPRNEYQPRYGRLHPWGRCKRCCARMAFAREDDFGEFASNPAITSGSENPRGKACWASGRKHFPTALQIAPQKGGVGRTIWTPSWIDSILTMWPSPARSNPRRPCRVGGPAIRAYCAASIPASAHLGIA